MRVSIITLSDSGYAGLREDESGKVIRKMVKDFGYEVVTYDLLPDGQERLIDKFIQLCDTSVSDLIFTTGGTGFSASDQTPEATLKVIERETPGISEAMRWNSLQITPRAMLSRATSGIRKSTLIVNLPGSPKAVRECLEYILPSLHQGLEILKGDASNCARV